MKKKSRKKERKAGSYQRYIDRVTGVPTRTKISSAFVSQPLSLRAEPTPVCAYCAERIEHISEALNLDEGFVHFDCALKCIAERNRGESFSDISYIGSGIFALVDKLQDGTFVIKKRIKFESEENSNKFKNYLKDYML